MMRFDRSLVEKIKNLFRGFLPHNVHYGVSQLAGLVDIAIDDCLAKLIDLGHARIPDLKRRVRNRAIDVGFQGKGERQG
jgi:hypothetical protein